MASKWLWCIFQLPLMSGLRSRHRRPPGVRRLSERLRGRAGRPARAARATRPRRCDTWSTSSARPNWATAAALSPPPTTVKPAVSATASATVRVPAAKRASSNMPMGPFQNTVRASVTTSAKLGGRAGADVETLASRRGGRAEASAPSVGSRGRRCRRAGGWACPPPSSRRHVSTWSGSNSESPTEKPCAAEEREAHAPADDQRVDDAEQRVDHAELVADLGPAEHGHERALGVVAQAEQHLDLLGQQPAGGAGQGAPAARRSTRGPGGQAPKASLT